MDLLNKSRILTVRLTETYKDVSYDDKGDIVALLGKDINLKLFGVGLNSRQAVKLISVPAEFGETCKSAGVHVILNSFSIQAAEDGFSAQLMIPSNEIVITDDHKTFYFCLKHSEGSDYIHQGVESGANFSIYEHLLPIWLMIIFIIVLLCLSGLFSGLNLGLMALDQTELKIVQNTGTEKERNYVNKIAPIREHGNFLLCSLLLGNVLVNNTLTILLDTLSSGLVAVIGATMGIVVLGEIIPQAICSRHGLAVGAYTIWLTKFFMLLTFPLSFPISKLLDKLLGAEIGTVYDKKKLIELLRVTNDYNDMEKEEVDIVTGALVYKDKTVKDVMTKVEDVYMLPLQNVLNFETVSDIRAQGYSRIPIFDKDERNIVHILFAKDLMFIDPDDNMPLAMVCEFYNNDVNFVFHDTPLNVMFNEFKSGDKGHMAFVQEINMKGEGDPFYETIGLVTLEDIIEEIIQQEIVDETDVITDNRTKKRRKREGWQGMEGNFNKLTAEEKKKVCISPQLTLAVFQYLTTSIEPFKVPHMNDNVLKKLLMLDVFREVKVKKDANEDDLIIIRKGKVTAFFILIIEGKVEVNVGREELVFESGPFTYFGIQALTNVLGQLDNMASSPVITHVHKVVTSPTGFESGMTSGSRSSLQKANTQNTFEGLSNNHITKRNSLAQLDTAGGNKPSPTAPIIQPFIPDYTVKAVTDVLYLQIRRATYVVAAKASKMYKKQGQGQEINEKELDSLLEKVAEVNDEHEILMRTSPTAPALSKATPGSPLQLAKNSANTFIGITGSMSPDHDKKAPPALGEEENLDSSGSFPLIDSNSIEGGSNNVRMNTEDLASNGPFLSKKEGEDQSSSIRTNEIESDVEKTANSCLRK